MPDDLVTLICPKCGAGLDIYGNTETLACHQCELQIQVTRGGGTLSLNGIVARDMEIHRWSEFISAGTAAARIEDSLLELRARKARRLTRMVHRRTMLGVLNNVGTILLALVLGAWIVRDKDGAVRVVTAILLGGAVFIACYWRWSRPPWNPDREDSLALDALDSEIARLEQLLAEKKR